MILCRAVCSVDTADCQGFAYGTLPGHPERGEETFTVQLTQDRDARMPDRLDLPRRHHAAAREPNNSAEGIGYRFILVWQGVPMPAMVDLAPAARQMAALLRRIGDDQLAAPTPCELCTLGDLVDHVGGLSQAFAAAATKDLGPATSSAPSPDAARLGADWRARIPAQLDALAAAWADPSAWRGTTQAGGVTLPAEVAGRIALNELVLHGWDIARASGQPFECEPRSLQACLESVSAMYPPDQPDRREGVFGPVVGVPAEAPLTDRVVGLSGRDPGWTARR